MWQHPDRIALVERVRECLHLALAELRQRKLRLAKRLGQHLLTSAEVLVSLAEAAAEIGPPLVIEVGCGPGNLTCALAEKFERVIALDLDNRLVEIASLVLAEYKHTTLHTADVLKQPLASWSEGRSFVLASNVPYCISGPFLARLALEAEGPAGAVLLLQREVADRLLASAGEPAYGSLSVLVGAFYEVEKLFDVPPGAFLPRPQVSSRALRLVARPVPLVPRSKAKALERILRAAFGSRRKIILNSLKHHLQTRVGQAALGERLSSVGVSPTSRAETVTPGQFAALAAALEELEAKLQ